jgi:hypothetical protein
MFIRLKRRQELKRRYTPKDGLTRRGVLEWLMEGYEREGEVEKLQKCHEELETLEEPKRWKSEPTGDWIKTAHLYEAIRTPAGPRQKYVCRLAWFREGRESEPEYQAWFWGQVQHTWEKELRGTVERKDCERIIAELAQVIPSPKRISLTNWERQAKTRDRKSQAMAERLNQMMAARKENVRRMIDDEIRELNELKEGNFRQMLDDKICELNELREKLDAQEKDEATDGG